MKTVGIRELKNHLSAYLREVKDGESVEITDRGEVVAVLHPPPRSEAGTLTDWLRQEGLLIRPALSNDRTFLRKWRPDGCPDGTAEALIEWLRRDKWEGEDD